MNVFRRKNDVGMHYSNSTPKRMGGNVSINVKKLQKNMASCSRKSPVQIDDSGTVVTARNQ